MNNLENLAASYEEMLGQQGHGHHTPAAHQRTPPTTAATPPARRGVHFSEVRDPAAPASASTPHAPHGHNAPSQGAMRETLSQVAVLHDVTAALAERAGALAAATVPREEWEALCARYSTLKQDTVVLSERSSSAISALQMENQQLKQQLSELKQSQQQQQGAQGHRRECESSPYDAAQPSLAGGVPGEGTQNSATLQKLDISLCRLVLEKYVEYTHV